MNFTDKTFTAEEVYEIVIHVHHMTEEHMALCEINSFRRQLDLPTITTPSFYKEDHIDYQTPYEFCVSEKIIELEIPF